MVKKKINPHWQNNNHKVTSTCKVHSSVSGTTKPPDDFLKTIERIFYKFLWNGGPDRIKRIVIVKNLKAGGLRMVNISEFFNALKISWLRRVIQSSENQEWYSLSKVDFHKLLSCGSGYSIDLSKNLSNPFWKDCLNSWAKFCNVCKVESVKQILCSPLWFNNNLIKGQNSYINNWFKKGIKQISDLLDINGNFYQFDILKEMYGINSTFLDYQSLIHKIPNYWKNMIINNRLVSIQTKYNVTCNIYVQYLLKEKKGCRTFYDQLIQADQITRQEKWINEMGYINDQEWNRYNTNINDLSEVTLKDFQFKINNKILVTKTFLHTIRKVEDNLCSYCNREPETILHLFVECDKVKEFWQSLHIWLMQNVNTSINMDKKGILFSYQGKCILKNYIMVVA